MISTQDKADGQYKKTASNAKLKQLHETELLFVETAAQDNELVIVIGKLDRNARGRDRVVGIGDPRWPLEQVAQMLELRAFERETCEPIFGHFEAGARIPHFPA